MRGAAAGERLGGRGPGRRALAALLAAGFAAHVFVASRAAAELLGLPGTSVSLEPPEGFVLSTRFPGVQNTDRRSSIVVTELYVPIEQVLAGLTGEKLSARGMTLRESQSVKIGGHPALLLLCSQTVGGVPFEKWMGVFGDETASVLLVASYPQASISELRADVREALLSVRWQPNRNADPFAGLTFIARESSELKVLRRIQNTIVFARPEGGAASAPGEPFAIVGSSRSDEPMDDVEAFARLQLSGTDEITDLRDLSGHATRVGGWPAFELTARANDLETATPLSLYQMVVVATDRYYLIRGIAGEDRFDRYEPQFRLIAESLRVRAATPD